MKRWYKLSFGALLMLAFCNGCLLLPIPYKGYPHKQFRGRIIDKNTRRPVPQVTIFYDYDIPGLIFPKGIMLRKATTDAEGKFIMDPICRYWDVFYVVPYRWGSPEEKFLHVQKVGYEPLNVALHEHHQRINWMLIDWHYTLFKHQWDLGDLEKTPATGDEANKERPIHIDQTKESR